MNTWMRHGFFLGVPLFLGTPICWPGKESLSPTSRLFWRLFFLFPRWDVWSFPGEYLLIWRFQKFTDWISMCFFWIWFASLCRNSMFGRNPGWWNIIVWPDVMYVFHSSGVWKINTFMLWIFGMFVGGWYDDIIVKVTFCFKLSSNVEYTHDPVCSSVVSAGTIPNIQNQL